MSENTHPSPALTAAFEAAIDGFKPHPRGPTLAAHLAVIVSEALARLRQRRPAAPASAARSAVDVLTDNALADEIAALRAGR